MIDLRKRTGGGSSESEPKFVGTVTNGGTFPTTRPGGAALVNGDYVYPTSASTFPFTIDGCTFNSLRDKGVYLGTGWQINPNAYQNTNETPPLDKTTESLSGTANYQNEINKEFVTEFGKKLDKATTTVSIEHAYVHKADGSDSLMQINGNWNASNAIVRRQPNNQIKVPLVPLDAYDAVSKEYVDNQTAKVDNVTTDLNASNEIEVKDGGLTKAKTSAEFWTDNTLTGTTNAENIIVSGDLTSNGDASLTNVVVSNEIDVPTPTADNHAATKKYVDDAKAKVDDTTIHYNSDDKLEVKDNGITTAKIADDAVTIAKVADTNISTAIPSTGATDEKLTTEKAVKDALDLKQGGLIAGDNITIDTATSTISSNQIDDTLATSLVKTYSIDKIKEEIRINGATFRGAFATKADLDAYAGVKEKNDRAVVTVDETHSNATTMYSYDGSAWAFEYVISTKALELDDVTIHYDTDGKLAVKDEGISLAKFEKHTADAGKAYTIATDGTTELANIEQYKRVSTFAGETGNTYTYYYLDTPVVIGTKSYTAGNYVWDSTNGFTLVADIGSGGSTSPLYLGTVTNGSLFPATRPDSSALVLGDWVKPAATSVFPFTIGTVTFTSALDTATYMTNGNWLLNQGALQKTSETPVNNKTTESINGASSTAVYQADINAENVTAINERIKHYTTMPTPSADLVSEGAVQYIGATTTTAPIYTHNYFYECQETATAGTYEYVRVDVQPSGSGEVLEEAIAPEYVQQAYQKGETVMKDGLRYESNVAIPATEEWTSEHWDLVSVEKALTQKQDILQYSTMPTASADWSGKVVQFIGETTIFEPIYNHNYFYECVWSDLELAYKWARTDVQPTSDGLQAYDTMPTPDATYLGKTAVYTGANTTTSPYYTKGTTYKCVQDATTLAYSWEIVDKRVTVDDESVLDTTVLRTREDLVNTTANSGSYVTEFINVKFDTSFTTDESPTGLESTPFNVKVYAYYNAPLDYMGILIATQKNGDRYICTIQDWSPAIFTKWVKLTGNLTQYSTMPAVTATDYGRIVQYTGTTTTTEPIYVNGYTYECMYDSTTSTYYWGRKDTQPATSFVEDGALTGQTRANLFSKTDKGSAKCFPQVQFTEEEAPTGYSYFDTAVTVYRQDDDNIGVITAVDVASGRNYTSTWNTNSSEWDAWEMGARVCYSVNGVISRSFSGKQFMLNVAGRMFAVYYDTDDNIIVNGVIMASGDTFTAGAHTVKVEYSASGEEKFTITCNTVKFSVVY